MPKLYYLEVDENELQLLRHHIDSCVEIFQGPCIRGVSPANVIDARNLYMKLLRAEPVPKCGICNECAVLTCMKCVTEKCLYEIRKNKGENENVEKEKVRTN